MGIGEFTHEKLNPRKAGPRSRLGNE